MARKNIFHNSQARPGLSIPKLDFIFVLSLSLCLSLSLSLIFISITHHSLSLSLITSLVNFWLILAHVLQVIGPPQRHSKLKISAYYRFVIQIDAIHQRTFICLQIFDGFLERRFCLLWQPIHNESPKVAFGGLASAQI